MRATNAYQVIPKPVTGLGLKLLLGLLLLPAVLMAAHAEGVRSGTGDTGGSNAAISISPSQLANATVSVPYSVRINPQGGTAPYRFAFVQGAIPPGLYFNTATGTVAGTPTTAGSFAFRIAIFGASAHGDVTVSMIVSAGSRGGEGVTVAVSPGSAAVAAAGTQQFSAAVGHTENTAVTWSASGGTITSRGLFTAPSIAAASTYTVTATSVADPTKHAQSTITVNPLAAGVSVAVSPTSSTLLSAGTQQFAAIVSHTSNTSVVWAASSGTITSGGLFTAPSVTSSTTETVTATSAADPSKHSQATITVNPAAASISVAVSPTSSSIISSGTQQFTATVRNTSNTAVLWTATGGTISSGGMFNAPQVSASVTATITATSVADPTKFARSTVTVNPTAVAVVVVAVSPASSSIISSATQQFVANVSNASNSGVTWSASSGTISAGGLFTAPSVTVTTTASVVATSVADTTKSALATVIVNPQAQTPPPPPPPPPPSTGADNTYCGTGNLANFGGTDTVATLPQACINTALANTPSPGKVTLVAAGGSVQSAINSAACGDVIQLQAGATFTGTFSLPNKSCDGQHWITIRTSAPDSALPPEGTRLTPCYAGVASLPGRPA